MRCTLRRVPAPRTTTGICFICESKRGETTVHEQESRSRWYILDSIDWFVSSFHSLSSFVFSTIGGTGYIGKYVVKEAVKRGYETTVVVRSESKPRDDFFAGAKVVFADVCDEDKLKSAIPGPVDAFVSCLASRSGVKDDSYKIDYQATLNSLNVAKAAGASNFVLLSAFCVRKPLLQFQNAKLQVCILKFYLSRKSFMRHLSL